MFVHISPRLPDLGKGHYRGQGHGSVYKNKALTTMTPVEKTNQQIKKLTESTV